MAVAKRVPLVDLNSLLAKEPEWMHRDGVHPSPAGNAIIAKHVSRAVAPLVFKPKSSDGNEADIIVFGGTSSGIVAAVQAARMKKSVILLEPHDHLGGLTTGGLGATDIGNKNVIGGLSREFYQRVARHYQKDSSWTHETREEFFKLRSKRTKEEEIAGETGSMWTFEPSVALEIFHEMLRESGVTVRRQQKLKRVKKEGTRITQIEMEDGQVYRAKVFIDATYEGDLMAKAGVKYRVGREANAEYDETLNGIRAKTPTNQIFGSIDPYVVPGDPSSGLIPLIQEGDGGVPGAGDHRVQAYNFRLCFTDVPANRLPLTPPENYDPGRYELAARRAERIVASDAEPKMKNFCNPVWMPNRKTDINNSQGISTDFIGGNYEYPDAEYEKRAEIWQSHEDYVRGFWYFMSTSPRIPEELRKQFLNFGPCKDEFLATGGWPSQLYVREARRMVSSYVMTEHNCRGSLLAKDSVGMAAYGMDSHNCQRIVKNGIARNEGDVQVHGLQPYSISYRSIVPLSGECENLVVPVCVSASHIAFGSIRMEPVFMVLGQSSAIVASLAIDAKSSVQEIDYSQLRSVLVAAGQVLERPGQPASDSIWSPEEITTDVCVYGGTASGVVTAVQVARMGKSVVLIEPSNRIGGMTSGGLGNTDIGKQASIGGVTREFYQSIHDWYQEPAHWKFQSKDEYKWKGDRVTDDAWFVFEPHVAELMLNKMLEKAEVPVIFGERLDLINGIEKEGSRIVSIQMESGQKFTAKVFIDCTYEGDLMAKAGVSYTVGREPNSQYNEKINGVQATEPARRGPRPLDPFVIPGDPKSGLIKGLQADVVGENGEGDKRVQAYNYRLCLTSVPENRVPFEKPEGYDESEYELLFRWLEAGNTRNVPLGSNPIPNGKTDTNKAGWISTDYIGMCDDYPDADYARRKEITDAHILYHKGFLWTLANHPRVPEKVRRRAAKLGFAKDEFVDNGHFPYQLYVREGRRMLGPMVMTEHELRKKPKVKDPVALGSYGMDSHPTQLWVDKDGALHADTPKWTGVGGPYGISYRAITPKADECSNLLVTTCISSSHSAYGSIRMEPVYMMLGQASATAAVLSIDGDQSVQEVPYKKLRQRLLKDRQLLAPRK